MATKTPKSNKTSKTTATSKATATKKTAAKKAAPARTAEAEPAAPKKAAAAPAPAKKAAAARKTPAAVTQGAAARSSGAAAAGKSAGAAAAGTAASKTAARSAGAQKDGAGKGVAGKEPSKTAETTAGKAAGKVADKTAGKTAAKAKASDSASGSASDSASGSASDSASGSASGSASDRASGKPSGKTTSAADGAADKTASQSAGKAAGKAAAARTTAARQAAARPEAEARAPETAKPTAARAAPARSTQRKASSRKAAAEGTPAPDASIAPAAPGQPAAPADIEAADRGSNAAPIDAKPQPTAEPNPGPTSEPGAEAEPATKSQMMDTTAKEGAPAGDASPEAEGPAPITEAAAGAASATHDATNGAADGATGDATNGATTAAAGNGERKDAAAGATEKRPVNVLRRPGASKSGRPVKSSSRPAWETYPEPLQSLVDSGRRTLGIDNLRPGQAEALTHILDHRDVLAVMPTGSGKSLLYQLPSLKLEGLTVVVSPLIALIKDQIDKMVERGVPVCRFDSTITVKQRREYEALVQAPGGKLVFVTPERISEPEFRDFLRTGAGGRGVSLLVVDEAHCVSQWGHDFRPSYLTLRKVVEDLGRPQLLATTATAPPHVREDILFQLGMPDAEIVTTSFERPNLHFEVIALPSDEDKLKTLVTLLKKLPRPGVVYCATVKKVEELHEALQRHAIPVAHYHGRMGKKDRDAEQQRLMEGKDLVMIATNAFGLGVDKANIRYVLHYHVPGSLEAYAQEAGRGGRDGKPARCVLLFSPDDVAIQEYFLTGTYPSRRQVRAVYKALSVWSPSEEAPPTIANLALSSHVGVQRTRTVLSLLKDEGFVVEREEGSFWLAEDRPSEDVLNEKAKQYEARRIADRQRLDALLAYVKTPGCRNQVILEYLGEPDTPPCGRCDNCQRSREAALAAADQASRLEAKATAELDQEWSADSGGREEEEVKPRRVIRHRVIRIDEPPAAASAASGSASSGASPGANGSASSISSTVVSGGASRGSEEPADGHAAAPAEPATRAAHARAEVAPDERPARRPANGQMRLPLGDQAAAAAAEAGAPAAHAPEVVAAVAAAAPAPAEQPVLPQHSDGARTPADEESDEAEYEDDEEYEDDDEEYEDDDEEGEEYEDDDAEYEDDEEGEEGEEYEDDEDDEDEDDEEYEDDDEEYEDDDEYEDEDDEDFELIEKTAAALAEEGYESDTEITILARKRVEKPRAPQKGVDAQAESEADRAKRRRKRRRRRKKRSMLPPKSAFITPVLSKMDSDAPPGPSRGRRRKAGPVIEYVRGPMRINMTPVASATPNDVAPSHKKKKRRRRRDEPVFPGAAASAEVASPAALSDGERGRKRRRRRRRKRGGAGMRPATHEGPVAFFSTQWSPSESGRDEQGRRRRRRKRRGRNGRPGREGGRSETPPAQRPGPPPPSSE